MKEDILAYKNNPSLHVVSGCLAFFAYALMLILLIGGFRFYKERVNYGAKESVMSEFLSHESIELADVQMQNDFIRQDIKQDPITQENIQETMAEPTLKKEVIQPSKETAVPKPMSVEKPMEKISTPSLADVFANVSSKTSQDIRREEEEKRRQELERERKQRDEAQKAKQAQLAQNALALEQSAKALQQATQNLKANIKQAMTTKIVLEKHMFSGNIEDKKKYDEWYAQIEKILIGEWQKSGSFYQATTSAKVRIRIDSTGKLTYLFMVSQSPYGDYNNSVIAFLRKMEMRHFPKPPEDAMDISMELENTLRY